MSANKREYEWTEGEERECRCQMYGGVVHYEKKRNWYHHQRRQAWLDQTEFRSQRVFPPLKISTQNEDLTQERRRGAQSQQANGHVDLFCLHTEWSLG